MKQAARILAASISESAAFVHNHCSFQRHNGKAIFRNHADALKLDSGRALNVEIKVVGSSGGDLAERFSPSVSFYMQHNTLCLLNAY